ncbi:MAG: queuosine 5'-phosphate N-glycosylase/hydrolase, partial [Solirubrobacteraceae bacterium]
MVLVDSVRAACAEVAAAPYQVWIDDAALTSSAAALPVPGGAGAGAPRAVEPTERAALILCLDAINFGSGWFPTLHKRPGKSGYGTVAAALRARMERDGIWSPARLSEIGAAEVAEMLGQESDHELMA